MRVFVRPPAGMSRAMTRVAKALAMYAPGHVEPVPNVEDAQLVVLHSVGFPDTITEVFKCKDRGQRYAILQYCLRTTQRPNTADWLPIWERAALVYSYFDLVAACADDMVNHSGCTFYLAPLGADPYAFNDKPEAPRQFTILTSGYIAEHEGIIESADAVRRISDAKMFHLGPKMDLDLDGRCRFELAIDDGMLARAYRASQFVAGLRREEGFELPAAEGLLCGARPIMFDRPHYRLWYDGFAEFIPEREPAAVTDALEKLFRDGPRPVLPAERALAVDVFSWTTFATSFWERISTR